MPELTPQTSKTGGIVIRSDGRVDELTVIAGQGCPVCGSAGLFAWEWLGKNAHYLCETCLSEFNKGRELIKAPTVYYLWPPKD